MQLCLRCHQTLYEHPKLTKTKPLAFKETQSAGFMLVHFRECYLKTWMFTFLPQLPVYSHGITVTQWCSLTKQTAEHFFFIPPDCVQSSFGWMWIALAWSEPSLNSNNWKQWRSFGLWWSEKQCQKCWSGSRKCSMWCDGPVPEVHLGSLSQTNTSAEEEGRKWIPRFANTPKLFFPSSS